MKANLIELGSMRPDFLKPLPMGLPGSIADGDIGIREMTAARQAMPGIQLGDPAKAVAALITLAMAGDAPLYQLLGSDSLAIAEGAPQASTAEIEKGPALTITTDIPQA